MEALLPVFIENSKGDHIYYYNTQSVVAGMIINIYL